MKAIEQMEKETGGAVSLGGKSFAEAVFRSCRLFTGEDSLAVIHRQKDSIRNVVILEGSDGDVFAQNDSPDWDTIIDKVKPDCFARNDGLIINKKYRTWVVVPIIARKETVLSIVIARRKNRFHARDLQAVNFLGLYYTQTLQCVRIRNKKLKSLADDIRHGILLNTQSTLVRNRVEWEGYATAVDYGAGIGSNAANAFIQGDDTILLSTLDITADNAERQAGLIYIDTWLSILSQTSLGAAGMLHKLNNDMIRRKVECYASIVLVCYKRQKERVEVAGCGNIAAISFSHATMDIKTIDFGAAAGITKEFELQTRDIPVKCGDIVCTFTDGISGTRKRNGDLFGIEAVGDIFKKHYYLSAEELASKVLSIVKDKGEKGVNLDDRTIQILKII